MQSRKTHEQQLRIIEGKENTKNGPKDLTAQDLLKGRAKGRGTPVHNLEPDMRTGDRSIRRGAHQESEHHKHRQEKGR